MKKESKFLSLLCSLLTALFLVTGAVAVPILWRGFYYLQIDSLQLPARSGFSPEVIRNAFDQVMDYLMGSSPFGTGQLAWSEAGMAHFADCRTLFHLDFIILILCVVILPILLILCMTGKVRLYRFWGRGPCFWALMVLTVVFAVMLVWALIDFESLFTAFHTLFFPGKTNWVFDWRTDEIILILPEDFWARAAALVGGVAFGGGLLLTLAEEAYARLSPPPTVYQELREMSRRSRRR